MQRRENELRGEEGCTEVAEQRWVIRGTRRDTKTAKSRRSIDRRSQASTKPSCAPTVLACSYGDPTALPERAFLFLA